MTPEPAADTSKAQIPIDAVMDPRRHRFHEDELQDVQLPSPQVGLQSQERQTICSVD